MRPTNALLSLTLALSAACASSGTAANVECFGCDSSKGKAGGKIEARWDNGQEAFQMSAEGGALEVTVKRTVNVQKGDNKKIEVHFDIYNGFDEEVHFSLGDARLDYQGREISAKIAGLWGDVNPDLLPKANKSYGWAFELPAVPEAGVYNLTVKNFKNAAGEPLFDGGELAMQVKVPGIVAAPALAAPGE